MTGKVLPAARHNGLAMPAGASRTSLPSRPHLPPHHAIHPQLGAYSRPPRCPQRVHTKRLPIIRRVWPPADHERHERLLYI
jgi:hypothetical protein